MTQPAGPAAGGKADGLVLIDKSGGMTSHDVVARVRRLVGTKKVGHAGTLDPMATGLLVLGVNRATRLLTYLVGVDKTYVATIRLGQATVTDDAEGDITASPGAQGIDEVAVRSAVEQFLGEIEQVPSAVSAIKVDGKRSYARVREGEAVRLAARCVRVSRFDVLAVRAEGDLLDVDAVIECSSGTYVRALARDLGAALGSAGHLTALRRTRVGAFDVAQARTLEDSADGVALLDPSEVARRVFTTRELSDGEATEIRFGRRIAASGSDDVVAVFAPDGHVLALVQDRGGHARPVLVLDPA